MISTVDINLDDDTHFKHQHTMELNTKENMYMDIFKCTLYANLWVCVRACAFMWDKEREQDF